MGAASVSASKFVRQAPRRKPAGRRRRCRV